jgi:three-Cys-motif partner protein
MGSKYRNSFFDTKREWSNYKDAVLNYYLRPYLQKVKEIRAGGIRKPICVVDMFAGRGEFKSGEPGSPRIIASHLQELATQGHQVKLLCYENYEPFYKHLVGVLAPYPFATATPKDCFTDIENIARIASTHTMLLYIDPCDVVQLDLARLGLVFEKVRENSSVEALIVFMALAFMRQAAWVRSVEVRLEETGAITDPLVRESEEDEKAMWIDALYGDEVLSQHANAQKAQSLLNAIAGGNYWEAIVDDKTIHWDEKIAQLVDAYRQKLRTWFKLVEALPVRPDTSHIPKYWIAFMSRYEPAFDLFNRAACEVARAQELNIKSKPGTLFAGVVTAPSRAIPSVVDRSIKAIAKQAAHIKWNELRWRTCGGRNVGRFTDSEVNQGIKRLLKAGFLAGASGDKVEEERTLSATEQLRLSKER